MECLRKMFSLSLDKLEYLKNEHDKNEQLFTEIENEEIKKRFDEIDDIVHSFILDFGGDEIHEPKEVANAMDKICVKIVEIPQFYTGIIQGKMQMIAKNVDEISE